jgi:ankyrin repeat protein
MRSKGVNLNQVDYSGHSPLYYAIRGDQKRVVEYLLYQNAKVNHVDKWGYTVLDYAPI